MSNIGWEKDFDIVLIDYDQDSIIKIDEKMFKYNRLMKEAKFIGFPYTYIPTYLQHTKQHRPMCQHTHTHTHTHTLHNPTRMCTHTHAHILSRCKP